VREYVFENLHKGVSNELHLNLSLAVSFGARD